MPVSLYFGFRTPAGPVGLWWGLAAGLGAVSLLLLLRVRHRMGRDLQRVMIDDVHAGPEVGTGPHASQAPSDRSAMPTGYVDHNT